MTASAPSSEETWLPGTAHSVPHRRFRSIGDITELHAVPPGGREMMERIAEASPRPRARLTGVVYLLYFLTAISGEVFIGHGRPVLYDAVDLIAHAFYIALTLLFFYLFKPVNSNLSLQI